MAQDDSRTTLPEAEDDEVSRSETVAAADCMDTKTKRLPLVMRGSDVWTKAPVARELSVTLMVALSSTLSPAMASSPAVALLLVMQTTLSVKLVSTMEMAAVVV